MSAPDSDRTPAGPRPTTPPSSSVEESASSVEESASSVEESASSVEELPELTGEDELVGRVLVGRYRVLRLLGVGGMAAVYEAEHVHMRKRVALKVLHRELALLPEIVARFEREAIAAGRIDDPHVVAAMDFGRLEDGAFYLALEYVQGVDLAHVMSKKGRVDLPRAVNITRQILLALVAAHGAGVVHRDLKPENVMLVERSDEVDFVKVLDFGIAKVSAQEQRESQLPGGMLTQIGSVFGTPEYMAPEQALGEPVDHRADLYTVALMLYEMLAGEPPFCDEDPGRVLERQVNAPPPPLPAAVPRALAELVIEQLAKKPAARAQSAVELLERLDAVCAGEGAAEDPLRPQAEDPVAGAEEASAPAAEAPRGDSIPAAADSPAESPPRRQIRVAGRGLPIAVAASVGVAALSLLALLLVRRLEPAEPPSSNSAEPPTVAPPAASRSPSLDPNLVGVMASASLGNPEALHLLESLPDQELSGAAWVALGRGRMELGQTSAALAAYGKALGLDPRLSQDHALVAHVRRAAGEDATADTALRLAAASLGSAGGDVLYDVWVATRAKTAVTQLAMQLVYSPEVRAQASPALSVALDLRKAKTCEEFQRLLPRVILHGDMRAARILQPLARKQGCGPGEKEDCYACLKEEDALDRAMQEAKRRLEPRF